MPLDVVRLRDSQIVDIDAEAFRAAVLAWCVAWHQRPAASLPDDDATLCRLLGYGRNVKAWLRIREAGALRGFVKCSDGRLYHAVVAEKAWEAWTSKLAQRDRTEAARAARLSQRMSQNKTSSVTDNVTQSKGEERRGEERKEESVSLRSTGRERADWRSDPDFLAFWNPFPRKTEGPGACWKAWEKAKATASAAEIIAGVLRYPFKQDFLPMAATWLNQQRWTTQADTPPPTAAVNGAKDTALTQFGRIIDALDEEQLDPARLS
ncbi:MAG TPA: hypothetical protein VIM11_18315 [Tepidisphaeraceae bacterium]|jgi:hypothetical protein